MKTTRQKPEQEGREREKLATRVVQLSGTQGREGDLPRVMTLLAAGLERLLSRGAQERGDTATVDFVADESVTTSHEQHVLEDMQWR